MKVIILGKQRKGEKDFEVKATNEFGYNIECFKKGLVIKLFNLMEIIWMNKGENVMLDPMLNDPFDFTIFEKVVIKEATENHGMEKQTYHTA